MISKELQKKWRDEADELAKIFKIFSGHYSPMIIATFFSATIEEANKIIEIRARMPKVLGLFTETWRLAIKKSLPPCGKYDFLSLLSEVAIIWEKNGCKGATIETLRRVWR